MTKLKIVHASIDENGKAHGGKAGDQTGREVRIQDGCNKNFTEFLRHPNPTIAKEAARIAMNLANSNLVGYDQYERNTCHEALKELHYDVKEYIRSGRMTEADCSSFVILSYIAAGVKTLEYTGNAPSTHYMAKVLRAAGFQDIDKFTDAKGKVGDILIAPGSHTVMIVENGSGTDMTVKKCYPPYTGTSKVFITALAACGEKDTSKSHRAKIYVANGFPGTYSGTMAQNVRMFNALKAGTLIKD